MVFSLKDDTERVEEKYRARLVARGGGGPLQIMKVSKYMHQLQD